MQSYPLNGKMSYVTGSARLRHNDWGSPKNRLLLAIQNREENLRPLLARYWIIQKTVAKWCNRISVVDVSTRPKDAKLTMLSVEDEAIIVTFRRHTLLLPESDEITKL